MFPLQCYNKIIRLIIMTAIPQNWHKLKAHKVWLRAMNYGIYLDNSPGRKVVVPPFVDEATEAQRVSKLTHNLFV